MGNLVHVHFLLTFYTFRDRYMCMCVCVYAKFKHRIIHKVLTSITYMGFESINMSYSAKEMGKIHSVEHTNIYIIHTLTGFDCWENHSSVNIKGSTTIIEMALDMYLPNLKVRDS